MHLHFISGMQVDAMNGDGNGRAGIERRDHAHYGDRRIIWIWISTPRTKRALSRSAVATGSSVAEAVPIPKPGAESGETRDAESDMITMKMRTGGKEIETVETAGAGTVDFLPNRPASPSAG